MDLADWLTLVGILVMLPGTVVSMLLLWNWRKRGLHG